MKLLFTLGVILIAIPFVICLVLTSLGAPLWVGVIASSVAIYTMPFEEIFSLFAAKCC